MVLQVEDLRVVFHIGAGWLSRKQELVAVRDVSFDIEAGETLAVVGESGSGKSTLARAVMRLVALKTGRIRLDGQDITSLRGEALRQVRPKMQMVFQDPYSSLDPSKLIRDIVAEPLLVHGRIENHEMDTKVAELLEQVGLQTHHRDRYPYEFSGGQRQRIAIARAIALQPKLLVLDEAVSALDVSTQNQILNLLGDLRRDLGMAYLFISHDLAVVQHLADRVAVTYLGRIVEMGPTDRIFEKPAHPYTQALLAAVPVPEPRVQKQRREKPLRGDVPSPLAPPPGCPFHTRCPHAEAQCREQTPVWEHIDGASAGVACHLWRQVSTRERRSGQASPIISPTPP
jgi:oligopeptide/dipeptide ABC transporter ATP-binding protein